MQIVPVPVRQDNYAYLLIDEVSKTAAAVDPYDVNKVVAAADNLGMNPLHRYVGIDYHNAKFRRSARSGNYYPSPFRSQWRKQGTYASLSVVVV